MKYYYSIILCLLTSFQLHSQVSGVLSDTLILYYDNNAFDLTKINQNLLESKVTDILKEFCDSVHITLNGYTDINGQKDYNNILAKKRLLKVEKLLSKNSQFIIDNNTPYAENGRRESTKSKCSYPIS